MLQLSCIDIMSDKLNWKEAYSNRERNTPEFVRHFVNQLHPFKFFANKTKGCIPSTFLYPESTWLQCMDTDDTTRQIDAIFMTFLPVFRETIMPQK